MISIKKPSRACLLIAILIGVSGFSFAQTTFTAKNIKVTLFSSAPLEDIKAETTHGVSVIATQSKQLVFQIPIKSFVFSKTLMQEHFNETYMESDKYPTATFKGIITNDINFNKDGVYHVSVKGILTVHNEPQERTIQGKISIENGKPTLYSNFDVACADHYIKIPSVVFKKIAETINVTVSGSYQ